MKAIIRLMLSAAALCFAASQVRAQEDQPPPYEKGPVWGFTEIKTKDGHFDDYMKFLDTTFKQESDAAKAAGRLLDYKIFVVTDPRQNEGNIYIARLYPNMAVFDHSTAEDFEFDQKVLGSITKANEASAARGSIRDILGETLVREITLK
jgi:hypothetical protein